MNKERRKEVIGIEGRATKMKEEDGEESERRNKKRIE